MSLPTSSNNHITHGVRTTPSAGAGATVVQTDRAPGFQTKAAHRPGPSAPSETPRPQRCLPPLRLSPACLEKARSKHPPCPATCSNMTGNLGTRCSAFASSRCHVLRGRRKVCIKRRSHGKCPVPALPGGSCGAAPLQTLLRWPEPTAGLPWGGRRGRGGAREQPGHAPQEGPCGWTAEYAWRF